MKSIVSFLGGIIFTLVVLAGIGYFAMGPGWRQFSAAEQKRVTDLFTDLVIRT
jgi:hypothetical protein